MPEEDKTVVGESITIKGEISGDQDLVLYGRVEGDIALSRDILIKPPSQTNANVKARNVTVSGRLEGNVEADQKVELSAEGKMVGDIHSPRIVIVDGAYFKGTIDMGDENERPAVPKVQEPPKSNPRAEKPKEDEPQGDSPRADAPKGEKSGGKDRRVVMPDYLLGKKK